MGKRTPGKNQRARNPHNTHFVGLRRSLKTALAAVYSGDLATYETGSRIQ